MPTWAIVAAAVAAVAAALALRRRLLVPRWQWNDTAVTVFLGDQMTEVFLPEVRFVYTVDGRTFEGNQVARVVPWTTSFDEVQKRVDRYPVHSKVEVYVDPQNPAVAYLETTTSGGAIFLLIFGGFFLFVGVLLTVIFAIVS